MEAAMVEKYCDLFVLCHSVSKSECIRALFLARWFTPGVPAVALEAAVPFEPVELPIAVMNVGMGPARLLATVQSFLPKRPQTPSIQDQKESNMSQLQGSVRWFNNAKGYGFLGRDDGGQDVFAHYSSIEADGYKTLKEGQVVTFDIIQGDKGPQADKVQVVR